MKQVKQKQQTKQDVLKILKDKAVVHIDLGCGDALQKMPGYIGVDVRDTAGTDIVQDLTMFPWKNIPDNCADTCIASHLLEHISKGGTDPRLAALVDLLLSKKLVTKTEIDSTLGDYRFLSTLVRFMNECWRILKPGGQLLAALPYAGSPGFWQDPSHLAGISHYTLAYFDPLMKDPAGHPYNLYFVYRPQPFKVVKMSYTQDGSLEFAMEKRVIDKSYNTILDPNSLNESYGKK